MDDKAFADLAEQLRRMSPQQLRELGALLEQAEARALDSTIVEIRGEPIDLSVSVGTGTVELVADANVGAKIGFSCDATYIPPGGPTARDVLSVVAPYLRTVSDIIRILGFVKDLLD
jgi:hypothetical protein